MTLEQIIDSLVTAHGQFKQLAIETIQQDKPLEDWQLNGIRQAYTFIQDMRKVQEMVNNRG